MRRILDFDDAGAKDDELAKGVTVGNIRAWHDATEKAFVAMKIASALPAVAAEYDFGNAIAAVHGILYSSNKSL